MDCRIKSGNDEVNNYPTLDQDDGLGVADRRGSA
jgi:hypothetical protein